MFHKHTSIFILARYSNTAVVQSSMVCFDLVKAIETKLVCFFKPGRHDIYEGMSPDILKVKVTKQMTPWRQNHYTNNANVTG